jgi:predicted transcriptional regulator
MDEAILEQTYAFLEDYLQKLGFSPTVREIAIGCNMSLQRTIDALDMLEASGKITRHKRTWRNIGIPTHETD